MTIKSTIFCDLSLSLSLSLSLYLSLSLSLSLHIDKDGLLWCWPPKPKLDPKSSNLTWSHTLQLVGMWVHQTTSYPPCRQHRFPWLFRHSLTYWVVSLVAAITLGWQSGSILYNLGAKVTALNELLLYFCYK